MVVICEEDEKRGEEDELEDATTLHFLRRSKDVNSRSQRSRASNRRNRILLELERRSRRNRRMVEPSTERGRARRAVDGLPGFRLISNPPAPREQKREEVSEGFSDDKDEANKKKEKCEDRKGKTKRRKEGESECRFSCSPPVYDPKRLQRLLEKGAKGFQRIP